MCREKNTITTTYSHLQILQTLLTFLFVNLFCNTEPKVMSRVKSPTALGIGNKTDFNQQQKLCNTNGCEKTFHCPSPKNPLVLCACRRCPWGPNPWLWEPISKGKKKIWNMTFDCNLDILVLLYFSGIRHPITWEFLVIWLFGSPPKDGYTVYSNAELRVWVPRHIWVVHLHLCHSSCTFGSCCPVVFQKGR